MGSWGPGVFENDHANDLLSIHTDDWATALRALDDANTSWDDVEGLLAYVYLLGVASRSGLTFGLLVDKTTPESSRTIAMRWKDRFLAIEDTQEAGPKADVARFEAFRAKRREVVIATFDDLIATASDEDAPASKKPTRKKPAPKKR